MIEFASIGHVCSNVPDEPVYPLCDVDAPPSRSICADAVDELVNVRVQSLFQRPERARTERGAQLPGNFTVGVRITLGRDASLFGSDVLKVGLDECLAICNSAGMDVYRRGIS